VRLSTFDFPVRMNDDHAACTSSARRRCTRGAWPRTCARWPGPRPIRRRSARLSADTAYNALLRTTCVATRLEGGHASNALPQMARAVVNCRILPDHPAEDVQRTLTQVVGDPIR
jgi:acetylornithine deacetylase/succinyl-diaminopimelate desuccinylase-like protein